MTERQVRQSGYALTEVLVAGAIASAVIMAGMGGLGLSARGSNRADMARQDVLEARNITARLRAGIDPAQIAEAYPDWQIDISPHDRPVDPLTGATLSQARLLRPHAGSADFTLFLVFLEAGPIGQEEGGQP
ncbi:type IV pilus modification PilV family protein [Maricaulis parjimensis]|uniref:type IV pilus modification PilV family protein n=1 Tax=Maricaulis parjimensis TaxID=144023 RepID=UPI001EEDFDAB|nr:type II secretion system protein [Maricaulis parjimensis]